MDERLDRPRERVGISGRHQGKRRRLARDLRHAPDRGGHDRQAIRHRLDDHVRHLFRQRRIHQDVHSRKQLRKVRHEPGELDPFPQRTRLLMQRSCLGAVAEYQEERRRVFCREQLRGLHEITRSLFRTQASRGSDHRRSFWNLVAFAQDLPGSADGFRGTLPRLTHVHDDANALFVDLAFETLRLALGKADHAVAPRQQQPFQTLEGADFRVLSRPAAQERREGYTLVHPRQIPDYRRLVAMRADKRHLLLTHELRQPAPHGPRAAIFQGKSLEAALGRGR